MDFTQFLKNYQRFDRQRKRDIEREILRAKYRESLFLTAKWLLGYRDITERTHAHICAVLQNESRRKLIVCPRGAFKSTIAAISYPIWLLINDPNKRILLDSELYSNARNWLREIKAQLEKPAFAMVFGSMKSDSDWTQGTITVEQRTRHYPESSITCGGVGTVKTGQHYDVIIADDLNSAQNSSTVEGREKVINHYKYYTSLLNPDGTIVVVGTRYAANDLIGHIIENEILNGGDQRKFIEMAEQKLRAKALPLT